MSYVQQAGYTSLLFLVVPTGEEIYYYRGVHRGSTKAIKEHIKELTTERCYINIVIRAFYRAAGITEHIKQEPRDSYILIPISACIYPTT